MLNADRLGLGHISACWTATFNTPETASGGPFAMTMHFTYVGPDGTGVRDNVGVISATSSFEAYCRGLASATRRSTRSTPWRPAATTPTDCWDRASSRPPAIQATSAATSDRRWTVPSLPAQTGIYNDILSNGSTLTSGTSQATDVESAAQRLGGASAILDGYVSLGLPQALASDDKLHSLIAGANADAFARTDPTLNLWGVQYASSVPDQVVNYYRAALTAMPGFDPADFVWDLVQLRALAISGAVRPYIVAPVGAQALARTAAAVPSGQPLAQDNALISPTIDRLDETRAALSDTINHGASLFVAVAGAGRGTVSGGPIQCPGTCSHSYTPGTSVTLTAAATAGSRFPDGAVRAPAPGRARSRCHTTRASPRPSSLPGSSAHGPHPPRTNPTPPPPPPAAHRPSPRTVAKCTLRTTSNRVPLAARAGRKPTKSRRRGTLTLRARCNQTAKLTLAGTLTQLPDRHHHRNRRRRTFRLRPLSAHAIAGRQVTLTIKVPAPATAPLPQERGSPQCSGSPPPTLTGSRTR